MKWKSIIQFAFIVEDSEELANADDLIQLITKEHFDAILEIEKADKKCTDNVLVWNYMLMLISQLLYLTM